MRLPTSLTTVTNFSKLLALFLFILFPLVGLELGMEYQRSVIPAQIPSQPITQIPTLTPSQTDDISNWKTYTNKKFSYTIKYPPELTVGNGIDPESAFDYVDNLYLNDKDGNFVDIYRQENPNRLQVEDWLNSDEFFNNNSSYKSLNVSSLTWYIFDPPLPFSLDSAAFKWGLFNDSDVFLVGNKTKLSDGTIERILSTFRFLDDSSPTPSNNDIKMKCNAIYDRDGNQTQVCP